MFTPQVLPIAHLGTGPHAALTPSQVHAEARCAPLVPALKTPKLH